MGAKGGEGVGGAVGKGWGGDRVGWRYYRRGGIRGLGPGRRATGGAAPRQKKSGH